MEGLKQGLSQGGLAKTRKSLYTMGVMERDKKNPMLVLALALLLMVAGSLLALLHVGMSARGANQIHYSFNARGAAMAASAYAADVGRGAAIAKARTAQVFDDFFGGSADTADAQTASAGSYSPGAGQQEGSDSQEDYTPDSDAFTKYYEKHYGKGADSANTGWNEGSSFGGGGFGGGGGGESATSQSANEPQRETAAAKPASEAPSQEQTTKDTPAASFPASGGAAYSSPKSSFPQAKASGGSALSSPPPPLFQGQDNAAGGSAGAKGMKTGGLDGFNNKAGAANLDGGLERASAGAKSDYGSKMSGGAAATAAAGAAAGGGGGGAASPVDASKDGKGAAGGKDAAKDAGSSSPVFGWWSRTGDDDAPAGTPTAAAKKTAAAKTTAAADPELIKAIVTERRNGAEAKYLTEEDEKAAPEETLLKSGAVALAAPADEKALKEPEPDPEDFSKLSADRKTELKKEIHSFLKRVENKYGKMTDIEYTACKETPDFCKEHGLERSYLTMTTANKARLVMGVKYVKDRWRRYTVDFKKPAGTAVTPAPKPAQEEVPAEEPADNDEFGETEFYE